MAGYRIVGVGDMNGDGYMDLLWQAVNVDSTELLAWYLNLEAQQLASNGTMTIGTLSGGYRCVGLGDYNSDGVLDILWQQVDTREIVVWFMNADGSMRWDETLSVDSTGLYVAHWQWDLRIPTTSSDINGDGHADLLLQRSGDLGVMGQFMNGQGGRLGNATELLGGGSQVQVVGMADMSGHPHGDLLVRRLDGSNTYEVRIRNESGVVTATRTYNPGGADWRMVGVYDQNKDGNTDLIWQNVSTGQAIIWYLNASGARTSFATLVASMADFRIVGVGDMNGDGHMDLLWQKVDGTTTQIVAWYLNAAGQRLSSGGTKVIGSVTGGYRCVGLGDYNSDGVLDILWQQVDNQQIVLWHMNALRGAHR
jgi:hypothetical protein